jgi:hypothetical protein
MAWGITILLDLLHSLRRQLHPILRAPVKGSSDERPEVGFGGPAGWMLDAPEYAAATLVTDVDDLATAN